MADSWILPPRSDALALFLDVDGTLLDIAPAPDLVNVGEELPVLLERIRERLGGSLALISGRAIADLDALFRPYCFPAAGIHGVERRDPRGRMHYAGQTPEDLEPARTALRHFVEQHPGLLFEDKGRSLAVHYRLVPELGARVEEVMRGLLPRMPPQTHVQPGHCVVELKSRAASKRTAIESFLQEPPFAGRVPIFVGDDVTDRDGFEGVERAGGHAVWVGPSPEPGRGWLPHPAAVREWLRSLLR